MSTHLRVALGKCHRLLLGGTRQHSGPVTTTTTSRTKLGPSTLTRRGPNVRGGGNKFPFRGATSAQCVCVEHIRKSE